MDSVYSWQGSPRQLFSFCLIVYVACPTRGQIGDKTGVSWCSQDTVQTSLLPDRTCCPLQSRAYAVSLPPADTFKGTFLSNVSRMLWYVPDLGLLVSKCQHRQMEDGRTVKLFVADMTLSLSLSALNHRWGGDSGGPMSSWGAVGCQWLQEKLVSLQWCSHWQVAQCFSKQLHTHDDAMWVMGVEPRFFWRSVSTPSCWAISPTPTLYI